MPILSEIHPVAGQPIMWHRWVPAGDLRGAFFFLHGQGDFAERYRDIAALFCEKGYAFLTCDLPGHGQTVGQRGHIPSFDLIQEIALQGYAEACDLAGGPSQSVGFGGHSVGGLLALACLPLLPTAPDFSWISSPILRPEASQPAWKTRLMRPLSHLAPRFTVSTGVTPAMCRIPLPGETPASPLLFHNRISLSWGRTLIDLGAAVVGHPEQLPESCDILLTQGGRDLVCPPYICENFVASYPRENLSLKLFPEARHEPFADESQEEVLAFLGQWLAAQAT